MESVHVVKDHSGLSSLSVLLIEDNGLMRELLKDFLDEIGIVDIHQLSNDVEGLEFMDSHPTSSVLIVDRAAFLRRACV